MMGKIVKFVFYYILFLTPLVGKCEEMKSPEYVAYVHEIVDQFSQEMRRDYNLICIGGGGGMPYDVEEICVKFHAYYPATIEKARELEIRATQRLLELVNQNVKIRPFLREYPFKPFRAEVEISFRDKRENYFADSVAYVFQVKNIIHYYKADSTNKDIVKLFSEPFEEGAKIVAQKLPQDSKMKRI